MFVFDPDLTCSVFYIIKIKLNSLYATKIINKHDNYKINLNKTMQFAYIIIQYISIYLDDKSRLLKQVNNFELGLSTKQASFWWC